MKFHTALLLLVAFVVCINGKPLDDDNPVQEGDSDKKDTIEKQPATDDSAADAKPADDSAAIADSPITDPTADKSSPAVDDSAADTEGGDKREITTTTTPTPTTQSTEETTTESPVTTPEGDKPSVEGSDNNTLTMKGTTFHVAIQDDSVQYYEEMNKNMHDIHRHTFQTMIGSVYKDDPEFKQVVIIKFSEVGKQDKEEKERDEVASPGVVVDMYLRFYNPGEHLKKLTEVIQSGQLQTHKVKPVFIRAYIAEPTGRVCTPDCKVQCFSYCDAGCCHVNIVQELEMPTPSPVEDFIAQQEQMLKTGIMPEKPKKCEGDQCQQQQQQQQQQPQPMAQTQIMQPQIPCQGASCPQPMMMMPPQMPCQGAACAPPMMPMMQMMPAQQMPCQGQGCARPMMPPQMPCQGASCPPPMMPPPMPCQGASCAPPMMQPMMPMMPGCAPSCGQICAPSCPSQCCGMQQPMMQQPMMQQPMMQQSMMQQPMYAPPARCGPRGC